MVLLNCVGSKTPEKKKDEPVRGAKKSESPAKMLEDLFRKTKAMPYIYWLPLSYEQAAEKAKKREILEKERLERIARRDADNKRENNFPPPPPPPPANRSAPVNQDIVSHMFILFFISFSLYLYCNL